MVTFYFPLTGREHQPDYHYTVLPVFGLCHVVTRTNGQPVGEPVSYTTPNTLDSSSPVCPSLPIAVRCIYGAYQLFYPQ